MKIVKSVRDIYDEQYEKGQRLKEEVVSILKPLVEEKGWFFLSRIKELSSFALKLETGRVPDPRRLEDFLGCTIVVPTLRYIEEAEQLVYQHFDTHERRPPSDSETPKDPADFRFDDLRLYVIRRDAPTGKNNDLTGVVFEVQVKTALQYAWGVATHDLTYKTESTSWAMERIASQLRAMLEHAEVAIASADRLAAASAVSKINPGIKDTLTVIQQVKEIWPSDRLPSDLKRLANNILPLLRNVKINTTDLTSIVTQERTRIGVLSSDLSPYAFVLQAVAHSHEAELKKALLKGGRFKIVVHDGMDLPEWLSNPHKSVIHI